MPHTADCSSEDKTILKLKVAQHANLRSSTKSYLPPLSCLSFLMWLVKAFCALAAAAVVAGEHAEVVFSGGLGAPPCKPLAKTSKVLDGHLVGRITQLLEESRVPGYSLVVVRPDASDDVEYFTWGNRTEDGDLMTPEVRLPRTRFGALANISP
jgi:hypothetical protein